MSKHCIANSTCVQIVFSINWYVLPWTIHHFTLRKSFTGWATYLEWKISAYSFQLRHLLQQLHRSKMVLCDGCVRASYDSRWNTFSLLPPCTRLWFHSCQTKSRDCFSNLDLYYIRQNFYQVHKFAVLHWEHQFEEYLEKKYWIQQKLRLKIWRGSNWR